LEGGKNKWQVWMVWFWEAKSEGDYCWRLLLYVKPINFNWDLNPRFNSKSCMSFSWERERKWMIMRSDWLMKMFFNFLFKNFNWFLWTVNCFYSFLLYVCFLYFKQLFSNFTSVPFLTILMFGTNLICYQRPKAGYET